MSHYEKLKMNDSPARKQLVWTRALTTPSLSLAIGVVFLYLLHLGNHSNHSPKSTQALSVFNSPFGSASSNLIWHPCGNRLQCANLSVPLDYLNPSDSR